MTGKNTKILLKRKVIKKRGFMFFFLFNLPGYAKNPQKGKIRSAFFFALKVVFF